jgi:hypothetical protein
VVLTRQGLLSYLLAMPKAPTIETFKKQLADAAVTRTKIHDDIMGKVKALVSKLNELDFKYKIVEVAGNPVRSTAGDRRKGKQEEGTTCPTCKAVTVPAHNNRQHRKLQGDRANYKKFTSAELAQLVPPREWAPAPKK